MPYCTRLLADVSSHESAVQRQVTDHFAAAVLTRSSQHPQLQGSKRYALSTATYLKAFTVLLQAMALLALAALPIGKGVCISSCQLGGEGSGITLLDLTAASYHFLQCKVGCASICYKIRSCDARSGAQAYVVAIDQHAITDARSGVQE